MFTRFALLPLLCFASITVAEETAKPKWELGIGSVGLYLPHYPGSDQTDSYLLPFPYVVYRGKFVTADRNGLRGILFNSERWVLDFSLRGALPVNSEDNEARRGMTDLDPSVEIGPELEWRFYNGERDKMKLQLPIRARIESDLSYIDYEGLTFAPNIKYDRQLAARTRIAAAVNVYFGDENYNDYLYEVAPQFATSTRPAYDADAGYSGSGLTMSLEQLIGKNFRMVGFTSYRNIKGATFADSPLVRQDGAFYAGMVFSYTISRSQELFTGGERD